MTHTTIRGKVSITVGEGTHQRVIGIENNITSEGFDRILELQSANPQPVFSGIYLTRNLADNAPNTYRLDTPLPFDYIMTDAISSYIDNVDAGKTIVFRYQARITALRDFEFDTVSIVHQDLDNLYLCSRANSGVEGSRPTYNVKTAERILLNYYIHVSIVPGALNVSLSTQTVFSLASTTRPSLDGNNTDITWYGSNQESGRYNIDREEYVKGSGKVRYKVRIANTTENRFYLVPFGLFSIYSEDRSHNGKTFEFSMQNYSQALVTELGTPVVAPSGITTSNIRDSYSYENEVTPAHRSTLYVMVAPWTKVDLYYNNKLASSGYSGANGIAPMVVLEAYLDPFTNTSRDLNDGLVFHAVLSNEAGTYEQTYIPRDNLANAPDQLYWSAPGKFTITGRLNDVFHLRLNAYVDTNGQSYALGTEVIQTFTLTEPDTEFGIDGAKQEFDLDLSAYKMPNNATFNVTRTDVSGNVSSAATVWTPRYPGLPEIDPRSQGYYSETMRSRTTHEPSSQLCIYPVITKGVLS